tara:strand:- start:547 stop:720 length:174 start_codon:yes stop_codon:yes gene_type:complete
MMGGNKDLLIQDGFFEEEMYEQMILLKKQVTAIKKILEVSNEKSITDDSNTDVNRMQ